jgi:hypothetical protein
MGCLEDFHAGDRLAVAVFGDDFTSGRWALKDIENTQGHTGRCFSGTNQEDTVHRLEVEVSVAQQIGEGLAHCMAWLYRRKSRGKNRSRIALHHLALQFEAGWEGPY